MYFHVLGFAENTSLYDHVTILFSHEHKIIKQHFSNLLRLSLTKMLKTSSNNELIIDCGYQANIVICQRLTYQLFTSTYVIE